MTVKQNHGFTFVEVLVAVFILATAISGTLFLYTSSMLSSQQAWDTTVAIAHGEQVLEQMQSRKTLGQILNPNWQNWAKGQNLYTVPQEDIEITFSNSGNDPVDVQVKVSGLSKLRENQIVLKTKITR